MNATKTPVKTPLVPAIPREVADIIERWRNDLRHSNPYILRAVLTPDEYDGPYTRVLRSIPFDTLLAALVNGYTVELTKRERVEAALQRNGVRDWDNVLLDEIERIYTEGTEATADGRR